MSLQLNENKQLPKDDDLHLAPFPHSEVTYIHLIHHTAEQNRYIFSSHLKALQSFSYEMNFGKLFHQEEKIWSLSKPCIYSNWAPVCGVALYMLETFLEKIL